MELQNCNIIIVKDTFVMPPVGETCELVLQQCADLMVGCWIWNPSCGYLEVTKYGGYDVYVTVKNTGMEENARVGTVFPSCMEFIISAPRYTPIVDNTLTCLAADFKSPAVDETALMVVESTSAIRNGDTIVVARDYQYIVEEIINETTMRVLNAGKGAEEDIKVGCGECVPVKIFESSHCCEVLQEQVDDIYNTLNDRHSIKAWTGNNIVTISGGDDALIASYDATIKVDDDLSHYDNSVSKFSSFLYFKEELVTSGSRKYAYLVPNTDSEATYFMIGKSSGTLIYDITAKNLYAMDALCSYKDAFIMRNTYTDRVGGGASYDSSTSEANYIYFGALGSNTEYRNGYSNYHGAHAFYSGDNEVFTIGYDDVTSYVNILPENNNHNLTLGNASRNWSNVYTDAITLNGTTYTSIPSALVYFEETLSGTSAYWKPINGTATYYYLGNSTDSFNKIYADEIQGGFGKHSHIYFGNDGSDTEYKNGTSSSYNAHAFYSGDKKVFTIGHDEATSYINIVPNSTSRNLGNTGNYWSKLYTNYIYGPSNYTNIEFPTTDTGYIKIKANASQSNSGGVETYLDNKLAVTLRVTNFSSSNCSLQPGSNWSVDLGGTQNHYRVVYTDRLGTTDNSNGFVNNAAVKDMLIESLSTLYTVNHISLASSLIPDAGNNVDLGDSSNKISNLYVTNENGYLYSPSDRDKKENIDIDKTSYLESIKSLETYKYSYKDDEEKTIHLGIMAQDLQEIDPLCVVDRADEEIKKAGDKDLYIDVMGYITILTSCIKELAQDVAELKKTLIKESDGK